MAGADYQFVLLTDIFRSSYLWESFPNEYARALANHNAVIGEAVSRTDGEILKGTGDGFIALYPNAMRCVQASVEIQRSFAAAPAFPDGTEFRIRVAAHAGQLNRIGEDGDFYGPPINRASRICQVCHPGQVLVSHAVKRMLPDMPRDISLVDLGIHRLRDLSEPEHLFQVNHPEFPTRDFPPLPTLDNRPNNLSIQPGNFIGRECEVKEIKTILSQGQRLVTVVAPGGYGKSRLANQVCADMLDNFERGAFEVLLAPVADPSRIVDAAAAALKFQFYGELPPVEQLLNYLKEKELLIHFDNFEHLMGGAGLVAEILGYAPKLKMLVTSREPLRLRGEKVFPLEPLPVTAAAPDSGDGVKRDVMADSANNDIVQGAVELFADRAALVRHDFALTPENLPRITQICARLDGVPLAIEMAAAWMDTFTVSELLEEVDNQLELSARMTDLPERHRSVRASLDWSWNLLTPDQRDFLMRLSVFRGGFFIEAAESVLGLKGAKLRAALAALCDKSWLFSREVLGKTRFNLRDAAAREYASQKLDESSGYDAAVLAHAAYFAKYLDRESEKMSGPLQAEAIRCFELELPNVYLALDTSLAAEQTEPLRIFARKLSTALGYLGHHEVTDRYYERMHDLAERLDDPEYKIYARIRYATGRYSYKDIDKSLNLLLEAKALAENLGNERAVADVFAALGGNAEGRAQPNEASAFYEQSLSIRRKIKDASGISRCLRRLGFICKHKCNWDEAKGFFEESIEITRKMGDKSLEGWSLLYLVLIALRRRKWEEAERLSDEALRLFDESGDKWGAVYMLKVTSGIAHERELYDDAIGILQKCIIVHRELGHNDGVCEALGNIGLMASEKGDFKTAYRYCDEALAEAEKARDRFWIPRSKYYAANIAMREKNYDLAELLIKECVDGFMTEYKPLAVDALISLGNIAKNKGEKAKRSQYCQDALSLARESGNHWTIACTLLALANACIDNDSYAEAAIALTEGLKEAVDIEEKTIICVFFLSSSFLFLSLEGFEIGAFLAYASEKTAAAIEYKYDEDEETLLSDCNNHIAEAVSKGVIAQGKLDEIKSQVESATLSDIVGIALNELQELRNRAKTTMH